jgi:Protein kinase domain/WD domain, G-beta repeat
MTAMAGAAGQLVGGRYRLVEPVGKGGMGQVWRGHDEVLEREVAVKEVLLPPGLPPEQRDYVIARTMREARATARLHHPGIVAAYDAIEHQGVPWIVMEFISGPALDHVIARDGRLSWQRVAALGADLADALAHAHSAGVVHRDLKPANILMAGDRPVLTDFGIARVLDATTQLTSAGTLIGTPQYMPPEQIEGESVQAPVDLWALGATLYTAVEGCPPFDGPTLTAVLAAILTRSPREPKYAGPMASALMSLMSKAPDRRPDAAALSGQLSALLRPSRHALTGRSPGAAASPASSTDTAARHGTPRQAAVLDGHSGRVHSVAFSPDGATLATGCDQGVGPDGSPVSGGRRVRLWNVATRTCTAALAGPQGAALSVAFSPDGTTLASGNSNDPVHLWRLTGRFRINGTTLSDDTDVLSVAFSPDGGTLATGSSYKTIRLWDVATRTCVATLTGHSGRVHSVAFSPDGTMVATGSSDHTVRLWDTRARVCIATLTGHYEIVREVAFSPDGAMLASGSADRTIRLWDTRARTCVATLTDTFNSVFSVAFSPDGAILASGGPDNMVRLWDPGTRTCVATLTGHSEPVASVAFSPDGATLASSSHDKTVRLWQLR